MKLKKRVLGGELCDCAVYGTMSRFLVNGNYFFIPDVAETTYRADVNIRAERFSDGSTSFYMQKLVPWDMAEDELEEMMDEALNLIEKTFGIGEGKCTSSEWWLGNDSTEYDDLLTSDEQSCVK
jgi:hypothetical protein